MTDLLRRATSSHKPMSASRDYSDSSSMMSSTSANSMFKLPRLLSKKSSDSSIRTDVSRAGAGDNVSLSSRRTHRNEHGRTPSDFSQPPPTPTSTRSSRRQRVPPSAFQANKYASSVHHAFDESNLQTSQQIMQEIAAVEAEAKRLMDAFHGLELSTLTKYGGSARHTLVVADGIGNDRSSSTLAPNRINRRGDNDAVSIQSGVSGHTAKSGVRSKRSGSLLSRPNSLHRKNSLSSMSSGMAPPSMHSSLAPPVPTFSALGSLGQGSASSLNLTRSTGHLPMASVPEDDPRSSEELAAINDQTEDIRRRREEVSKRYEARLEYLRAKLKGAQLHEKLMKK
jgi:hypothetical protein